VSLVAKHKQMVASFLRLLGVAFSSSGAGIFLEKVRC
jgi:hypothetical protein